MDRLLRPRIFETEPTDSQAEKSFKHWKMTFENFVEEHLPVTPAPDTNDAAAVTAAATAEASRKRKLHSALINNISANIHDLIAECTDYDSAMTVLQGIYVQPTNVVYNRHVLITTKQNPGQSIDNFKHELERLAKTCNFQAVSAEENRKQ